MKNWDIIIKECPRLYKKCIYFECDLVWFDILHDLSIKIEKILNGYADNLSVDEENECIEMYAVQVKEKYGELRFYMSCETDEINSLILEAEGLCSQMQKNDKKQ